MLAEYNKQYIKEAEVGLKFLILTIALAVVYRHSIAAFVSIIIFGCLVANDSAFISLYIFDVVELSAAAILAFFIVAPILYLLKGPPNSTQ